MGYKLGDKATVSIIDKKTNEVLATQEIQTSDIMYCHEDKDIIVKMNFDMKN